MVDEGTLATTAQVLLAIGENASAAQILEANTNIWILMAESDMENLTDQAGLVANYGSITAANKQWLASVASHRAAFYAINENQNSWSLSTTQSKLNVIDSIWQDGKDKLEKPDIIANLNL
ncbi:hypothetical protein KAR91_65705 [Candidatus Pacearchaeota archaeon]|nr:hypothetical protein [Candidatus Pacearchaeota archaeon]